ncbi:MAG TPA: bifunctional phosphoribosylaminoimidazolecarboxamide formyltransferase/IMP cyclohydrolase, partial [Rhodocyclaceae bacterium]|nr:bifunctional phosphoribosylaminoimidazolecarboxamide formyltransferase/IMP cyclohydrolase [Rhodocyclaceae bacterium]
YTEAARAVLAGKPNLRVLEVASLAALGGMDCRRIGGGLLVQTHDLARLDPANLKVVTRRAPDAAQWRDLLFAWAVARHVKSNAIVHCRGQATLGVGAGQMSRIDSARIAALKARSAGLELAGSAVASDAFFPFRDGVDVLAESGAAAIIQPGGSVRDAEVIAAADEHGMAMVFTGMRHFRH